ncbi:sensor domain-containing diguanylate cyclase [Vibrio sp. JC009]|uniref:diguanylate cyclase n=1 Tax=Vibrio sp. JC009 TaxID=2912314 RepID=UPI0023AECA2D|nr:diguanylate cyclase [Vibrio sp. JC009]WED23576.1 sensor domain-containing diguanylate cyclase [Vibrio sp. JC009]
MKYVLGQRATVMGFLAAFTALAILIIEHQHSRDEGLTQQKVLSSAQRELLVVRSNLEADIYSDVFYANSVATLASVSPDSAIKNWDRLSAELYDKAKHLKNIALAPDDVIRFIYPHKENEKALGLDFRTVPAQWETVKQARELQSIFLAGPINLVQGGVGLIARMPIFTDPPDHKEYWGTASIVMDLESLFQAAGVNQLQEKYDLSIRGKDSLGSLGDIFWGNPGVFDSTYVSERVSLPSGSWEMAVSLDSVFSGLKWHQKYTSRLIGYPILVVLLLMAAGIYYQYQLVSQRSLKDDLTGLPNRRYFIYTLEQMMEDVRKKESGFTLLDVDLDKFRSVNDTYGHAVGDKFLAEISRRIKHALRASDIVARVGGDEFLIILPRVIQEEDVVRIVRNLEEVIVKHPVQFGYSRIYPEVSIGYAIYLDMEVSSDELISLANSDMYEVKVKKR